MFNQECPINTHNNNSHSMTPHGQTIFLDVLFHLLFLIHFHDHSLPLMVVKSTLYYNILYYIRVKLLFFHVGEEKDDDYDDAGNL